MKKYYIQARDVSPAKTGLPDPPAADPGMQSAAGGHKKGEIAS